MSGKWQDWEIEILRTMWGPSYSASEIAAVLDIERLKRGGFPKTSNAVIGKAHRLGLPRQPSPMSENGEAWTPKGRQLHRGKPKPTIAVLPVPKAQRSTDPSSYVEDSKGFPCRWPIGDPRDKDFHFCSATSAVGKPYCPEHCAVAYIHKKAA